MHAVQTQHQTASGQKKTGGKDCVKNIQNPELVVRSVMTMKLGMALTEQL